MSKINRLLVLTLFGFALVAIGLTANAQVPPVAPVGLGVVPLGNAGNGITETTTWSSGVGGAASTDSFVNSFFGPTAFQGVGGPFGFGCGGFPSAFTSAGPFQTGVGGNFGAQNSAACGGSTASSFGLQPIGLAFGIPVAGPNGLLYT